MMMMMIMIMMMMILIVIAICDQPKKFMYFTITFRFDNITDCSVIIIRVRLHYFAITMETSPSLLGLSTHPYFTKDITTIKTCELDSLYHGYHD